MIVVEPSTSHNSKVCLHYLIPHFYAGKDALIVDERMIEFNFGNII